MKYLIFAMTLFAFVGCKDNKKQEEIIKTETVNQSVNIKNNKQSDETLEVYKNTWIDEIKVSDNGKWSANKETNEGVKNMLTSIATNRTNSLENYQDLAEQLSQHKNYIIKNCTMKGDSHDNLHVWLLPLMAKIEALSETKTVEDASKIKSSIEKNINAYSDFFE
ncbi:MULTISPECIES: hypothetical protein [unclassified Olleya]|uniref:hypothetical protein n=1 Tax=unclassified Olleya TaxID=2615019 RepID=UPI000C30FF1E|nr:MULTISPECIES: hypothetical protein [unclassified Olleya]AUC76897.1 hypothetical protein CW732_14930 [Olleya sp. Bg11-27]QXP59252.1 hypothetical protein H0I26_15185 [Olleya sp. HaHaR_3_96]